jgi:hypothetical protein
VTILLALVLIVAPFVLAFTDGRSEGATSSGSTPWPCFECDLLVDMPPGG